jgi:hypothetical protein
MGQDAPPPLIRQHSRESHYDETLGKYIHTKKKNRKNLFFFFLLAFPALPSTLKKLKEKTATVMGREKK